MRILVTGANGQLGNEMQRTRNIRIISQMCRNSTSATSKLCGLIWQRSRLSLLLIVLLIQL